MKLASEDQKALAGLAATLLDMALVAVLAFGAMDRWAPPQDLFWKPRVAQSTLASPSAS